MLGKRKDKLKQDLPPGTQVWFKWKRDDEHEILGTVEQVSGLFVILKLGDGQVIRLNVLNSSITKA